MIFPLFVVPDQQKSLNKNNAPFSFSNFFFTPSLWIDVPRINRTNTIFEENL